MRLAAVLSGILILTSSTFSATIYVPDDYATIQGGIDATMNGDTVIVRQGTYVENIDFFGKAITVLSQSGPTVTIIDGNEAGSVVTFKSGEGHDSVLGGFKITNGSGTLAPTGDYSGGGIYCESSSPTITNSIITRNNVPDDGGGMFTWYSNPIVTGCTFSSNWADKGGGMHNFSSDPLVTQCTFHLNNVTGRGGGMHNYDCESTVINCAITYNATGSKGGGISNTESNIEFSNCTIIGNQADFAGGGIYSYLSDFSAINCTISENYSYYWGGGLYNHTCSPTATNCILWGNTPEEIVDYNYSYPVVAYSCIQGGYPGTGNIDNDPLFADSANDDIHLTWNSPCRGAGDNSVVTEPTDFEGDPRVALGTVDMGADEFYYHLYHGGEVVPGFPINIKVVGYPSAPVLLALGSGLQDPPLNTQHGDLWLQWPPLWQGNIGTVPSDGILVLPVTVPTNWTPGSEHYLQSLIGPWGGSYTRLSNHLTLTAE